MKNNMVSISQKFIYYNSLLTAGFSHEQALVYETLLKNGGLPASKIAKFAGIERTLVYKHAEKLVEDGLIIKKDDPGKVAVFEAVHPTRLQELAKIREQKAISAKKTLDNLLPQLVSDFNLVSAKPAVQFYEGLDGAVLALKDSLRSNTEICSYINSVLVEKHFPEINEEFVGNRHKLQVPHRVLVQDSNEEKILLKKEELTSLTQIRLMKTKSNFPAIVRIYGNSVCFQTLDPNKLLSVVIRDPTISATMQLLFNTHWEAAKTPFEDLPKQTEIKTDKQ